MSYILISRRGIKYLVLFYSVIPSFIILYSILVCVVFCVLVGIVIFYDIVLCSVLLVLLYLVI